MYNNIGRKIKILAQVSMWIGIIGSFAGGIAMIAIGSDDNVDGLIISGILVLIFGSLFSWSGSFAIYGIGQVVENTDKMIGNYNTTEIKSMRDEVLEKLRAEGLISNNEYCMVGKNE